MSLFSKIATDAQTNAVSDALNNTTSPITFSVARSGSMLFPTDQYVCAWDSSTYNTPDLDPNARIGLLTSRTASTMTVTWGRFSTSTKAIAGTPTIALLFAERPEIDTAQPTEDTYVGLSGAYAVPETFGAAGDGVTDDTVALQAWVASGKHIALTRGKTYLCRQAIWMNRDGQVLDGRGATILRTPQAVTTTTTTITANVTKTISVPAISGGAGSSAWSITVNDYVTVVASGLATWTQQALVTSITGSGPYTLTVSGSGTGGAFDISLSGTSNVYTGWNQLIIQANYCRLYNTVFDGGGAATFYRWTMGNGVYVVGGGSPAYRTGTIVEGCRIINQPTDSIAFIHTNDAIFAHNIISNGQGRGVCLGGTCFGSRVIYNRIDSVDLDPTSGNSSGGGGDGKGCVLISNPVGDYLVHGNRLTNSYNGVGSISSQDDSDGTITNNEISNMSHYAVDGVGGVDWNPGNVLIQGNRIYYTQGIKTTVSGTDTVLGTGRWIVKGNLLYESPIWFQMEQQVVIEGNVLYSTTPLTAPAAPAASAVTSGGTFAGGTTYYYVLTFANPWGETVASSEVSATPAANGAVNLSWTDQTGAWTVNVYRSTTSGSYGASSLLATVNANGGILDPTQQTATYPTHSGVQGVRITAYTDTGTTTTTGTPPGSSTAYFDQVTLTGGGNASIGTQNLLLKGNIIYGGYRAIFPGGPMAQVLVDGNLMSNQNQRCIEASSSSATQGFLITNNIITNGPASNGSNWIGIRAGYTTQVKGNTVDMTYGSGYGGVVVTGTGIGATAKLNNITGTGTNATSPYRIQVQAGAVNTVVKDNVLDTTYVDGGTTTALGGNVCGLGATAPTQGTVALSAGVGTVSHTNIKTGENIRYWRVSTGGTLGVGAKVTIVQNTSFTITSVNSDGTTNVSDTSTYYWELAR